jgi:hypothetical protein
VPVEVAVGPTLERGDRLGDADADSDGEGPVDVVADGEVLGDSDGFGDGDSLADADGLGDGELLKDSDGLGDGEPLEDSDGLGDGEPLVDADGLGDGPGPEAGQVWVRLKKDADPVMDAVALFRVQPDGVVIHAFEVAGPPLAKSPGSPAAVIVIVPWPPKSAVTDVKSPLLECWPGRTNTHTSSPIYGPPPWLASQVWLPYPAAVVGTLPELMPMGVSAQASVVRPKPIIPATVTMPARCSSLFIRSHAFRSR